MRVAIVGGGLFGCTAALVASRAGHDVHLFERAGDVMLGATAGTYSRLHRGYHYPRSPETGLESRLAERSFRAEYGASVIDGGRQTYIVAPGGHVTPAQYGAFLDASDLRFTEEPDGVFEVVEPRIDLSVLTALVRQKIKSSSVSLHLGASPDPARLRNDYDQIVVAAYSGINRVLENLGCQKRPYKFQVVERPVALLPETMRGRSIVVVDGPFGCLDPLDASPLHVLGHVKHTVHAENTGNHLVIPESLAPLIGAGLLRDCPTKINEVVHGLAEFVPDVAKMVYAGSSFVVRAVLANVESTDERPTQVYRVDDQVISVFSGKLGTAVTAARSVSDLLERHARRHRTEVTHHRGVAHASA